MKIAATCGKTAASPVLRTGLLLEKTAPFRLVWRLATRGNVRIFLFILGVGAVLGVGGFYARQQSLRHCREGALLLSASGTALPWAEAASRDRFFAQLLRQGPTAEAVRELRFRAALGAGEALSWHLPKEGKAGLKALLADPATPEFREALAAAGKIQLPAECRPENEDPELTNAFRRGESHWQARQTEVRMAKLSFARDQEIFCQSDGLITRLRSVLVATEARCQKAKRPCPPEATQAIRREIEDIEVQKEFNRQKLKRKWPEEILEGLAC